jgi:hypothetical protein
VKQTRDRYSDLGGRAIPTSVILARFPLLLEAQKRFHEENDWWQSLLRANDPHPGTWNSEANEPFRIRVWAESLSSKRKMRDIEVVPKTSLSPFRLGDTVTIGFESSQDAYLVLINEGSSGRRTVLVPNVWERQSFLRAGVAYSFPIDAHPFEFQLRGPSGIETIWAIATKRETWRPEATLDENLVQILREDHAEARCVLDVRQV